MRVADLLRRTLILPSLATLALLAGCDRKPNKKVIDNHPTINLFGFEESQLHHIHNTVELHRNIFLVRYDPKSPDRLEWVNCPIAANYTYQKSAGRRVESMYIRSFADLQARVPVNYARFAGYVKGGKALEFNYVTIGSYELLGDFKIPKNDPDCARATHYVVTLSVGAFTFAEEAEIEGGIKAEAAGTGVGVGVAGGRASGEMTSVGDLQACMDDGTAAMQCFTPLQLMMMPIANRHWDDGSVSETGHAGGSSGGHQNPTHDQDLALRIDENAWRPGSFMATALERLLVVASRVNMTTNYGFDDQGSTVVAGFLRQGKPQYFTRPLEAGKSYALFAAGSTVANIDLHVFDSRGTLVAADTEADGNPAVSFTPQATDNYRIELSVVNQAEEFGALVVMQEGGLRIESPILQHVFQRLLDSGAFASAKVQEMGFPNGLVFHENDWALQGVVLYPGEAIRQRGISLDANSAVFAAVSHDDSLNIDLEVIDANTGHSQADTAPDSNPMVIIDKPNPSSTYDVRLIYGAGASPTLATSLILKLSD
ncbi:MAG: hypothetical protein R6X02_20350 [Enhygromyxa sp.]